MFVGLLGKYKYHAVSNGRNVYDKLGAPEIKSAYLHWTANNNWMVCVIIGLKDVYTGICDLLNLICD